MEESDLLQEVGWKIVKYFMVMLSKLVVSVSSTWTATLLELQIRNHLKYSHTSTNGHPSTTAIFFVPVDGRYIHSYFSLFTTTTSPPRQQPLKRSASQPPKEGVLATTWTNMEKKSWDKLALVALCAHAKQRVARDSTYTCPTLPSPHIQHCIGWGRGETSMEF